MIDVFVSQQLVDREREFLSSLDSIFKFSLISNLFPINYVGSKQCE